MKWAHHHCQIPCSVAIGLPNALTDDDLASEGCVRCNTALASVLNGLNFYQFYSISYKFIQTMEDNCYAFIDLGLSDAKGWS